MLVLRVAAHAEEDTVLFSRLCDVPPSMLAAGVVLEGRMRLGGESVLLSGGLFTFWSSPFSSLAR